MQISGDDMGTDDDQMQLSESSSEALSTRPSLGIEDLSSVGPQAQASPNIRRANEPSKESSPASGNIPGPDPQNLPVHDSIVHTEIHQGDRTSQSSDASNEVTDKPKGPQVLDGADVQVSSGSEISAKEKLEDLQITQKEREHVASIETEDVKIGGAEEAIMDTKTDMPDTLSANPPSPHDLVADDLAPELRASREPESMTVVGLRRNLW